MNRSLAVARMHLVDRRTIFALPTAVLALVVAINLTVWTLEPRADRNTGAVSSIYIVTLALAVLAVTRGFPFALGMGASRKAFGTGTALTGAFVGLVLGTGIWLLGLAERASDGWGLGGHFFYFSWLDQSDAFVWWFLVCLGFVACCLWGGLVASVFLRWGMPGLFAATMLAILVAGVATILATWHAWWGDIWTWFTALTPLTASGWLLVLSVALAALSWAALRRTAL